MFRAGRQSMRQTRRVAPRTGARSPSCKPPALAVALLTIKRSRRGYPWLQPWGGVLLSFLHSMTRRQSFRSNKNVVYSCLYHVVFCPKYRRPVLVDGVVERLKEIVATTAEAFAATILEMEVLPEHVQLLVEVDPQ